MSGKRAKRLRREESGEDEQRTQMTRAEARDLFKRADAIGEFIANDADFNKALAVMHDVVMRNITFNVEEADAILTALANEAEALALLDNIRDDVAAEGNIRAAAARAAAQAVRADAIAQGYPPAQAVFYANAYVFAARSLIEEWMGPLPVPEEIPSAYADEFACSPYGRAYAAVCTERLAAGDGMFEASAAAEKAANKAKVAQSQAEFDALLDAYNDHLETRPDIFHPASYRNARSGERQEWA